ncbi:hypothetical protein L0O88_02430 [Bacteroides nordii]|mgnify:CR=1 FL=1|uniref:hypothetical protein n=1 Tax=Bacteroides nordii TaxID=291645 RepID=UPI001EDD596F|nr:hypothetical protein [Bacteroides nordii]MCG4767938.1 hypothetical protein [Bacteroides nordii]
MNDADSILYQKVMDTLSYKDFKKVYIAVTNYVFSGKEPSIRGCRKDAFEKLRPILNRCREELQVLKKEREKQNG